MLAGLAKLERSATYMKPVETGCEQSADGKILAGPDVRKAFGFIYDEYKTYIDLHSPYRFHPVCSPHLAARESKTEISIDHIVLTYEKLKRETSTEVVIVEGAGGVLVPISDEKYMADVMKAMGLPAILVVEAGLGTLNHTFMSMRVIEQYDIPLAGIVINNARNVEQDFIYEDNVKMIRQHVDPLPCLEIGYGKISNERLMEFCNEIVPCA
jgi:dethiobiotin synthase